MRCIARTKNIFQTVFTGPGPTLPVQPLTGPGGSQTLYNEAEVICSDGCNYHPRRTGEYILYRPIRSTDEPLPVIIYLNGYEFFDWDRRPPVKYADMARHFALQCHTVICPVYGEALYPDRWVGNVIETITYDAAGMNSPAYPFMPLDTIALPSDMSLFIIMAEESYRNALQDESCFSPELSAACADFNNRTDCFFTKPPINCLILLQFAIFLLRLPL